MPRIPDELLNSIVYLFKDEASALSGSGGGGTGFLVRFQEDGFEHTYVVSNMHVVGNGYTTLRLNTAAGAVDAISIPAGAWINHPNADDVSVAPMELEMPSGWQASGLYWDSVCPTDFRLRELNVGIGDDVFMLGRFVGHSGIQQNQPLARFGSLAMMDGGKVLDGREMLIDAYLVEMHSLPGFSGSPVFIHIQGGSQRSPKTIMPFFTETIGLLGIDTGHKRMTHVVRDRATDQPSEPPQYVRENSGVAIVAPYYKIREVLEGDKLTKQRKDKAKALTEDSEMAESDA
ncbi:MAG TPA: hypothetical protein VIS51_09460 [Solirubrobacterales bacterium]